MPNRILKDSICVSDNLNQLTAEAERLFYRIIVNCDDYGRMEAHPKIIRAKCFPLYIDKITDADVSIWLQALADANLITFYTANGQRYLYCTTWEKHQQIRAKRSKYPNPPAPDINCNQLPAIVTRARGRALLESNPIQSNQNPIQSPREVVDDSFKEPETETDKIFRLVNDCIQPMNEIVRGKVDDALKYHSVAQVREAVDKSIVAHAHSWTYVDKILSNPNNGRKGAKAPPDARELLRQEKENARPG